jgi:outer membrane cobalamin receptor
MKKIIELSALLMLLILSANLVAQRPVGNGTPPQGGMIKGIVMDASLKTPVEYATVSVFRQLDSSLVTGCVTNEKGSFVLEKIRPGKYYVEMSFIGYHKKTVKDVRIGRGQRTADLKTVFLNQASEALGEVVVTSDRAPIQYKIDKKVVPVSSHHTAASGTAVDVLENVPSVNVDIDGNVALRGSTGFTVLIDGRPTVLDANDALQQMPSSAIENIEIITNPSAKYDPEGNAGIINIITKKGKVRGMSGLINLNTGLYGNYGGDMLFNWRKKKYNYFIGIDYANRAFPGSQETENRTLRENGWETVRSAGDSDRDFARYGIRAGIDFQLDTSNYLSFGARYGGRSMEMSSELNYEEWSEADPMHQFYTSNDDWTREMEFVSANMEYKHQFQKKGHELVAQVDYSWRDGDEESENRLVDENNNIISGQRSTEDGPGSHLRWKMDYTLPLKGKAKLEAGYQGRYRGSEDATGFQNYDADSKDFIEDARFINDVDYKREIHSLYSIYSGEAGKFGYQLGLRGEYTNRNIELVKDGSEYSIDRWDYFPTVHTSYNFDEETQMMASYTRRIQRARRWYLEPFVTWTDAYNVRKGNPGLDPEFIDSYELGFMKRFGQHMISLEGYYRVTHNKVERVRSVYDDAELVDSQRPVMLSTVENVGEDYSLGSELMISLGVARWLKTDIIGNVYHYKEEGQLYDQDFSVESFNWNLRNNNTFKIDNNTRIQIILSYNSPSDYAQGEREGFFMTNAAFKRDFMKRKLSATLQVRDVFSTAKHESTSQGPGFYTYSLRERKTPMVMLNLSFKINNYKQKRGSNGRDNGGEDEFEM